MKVQYFSLLFPLPPGLWKRNAERSKSRRQNFRSTLFCQWRGGYRRANSSDLPLPPVHTVTDSPGRGGGGLLVGVFAPVWTWGRGGFTWRLREEATLVERRSSIAAQLSRAERRGAVRKRRLNIRQLEERTLTNPYGCLRNTDKSPLPPLFFFLDFFGF